MVLSYYVLRYRYIIELAGGWGLGLVWVGLAAALHVRCQHGNQVDHGR